VKRPGSKQWL